MTDRRKVISGLGLGGLGLLLSSTSAGAFTSQKSSNGPKVNVQTQARQASATPRPTQRIDLSDLSAEWTRSQGAA
ncbi:MAG: hypothetical protein EOP85_19330, partial [Verrucomicrobiaceae bacterium]